MAPVQRRARLLGHVDVDLGLRGTVTARRVVLHEVDGRSEPTTVSERLAEREGSIGVDEDARAELHLRRLLHLIGNDLAVVRGGARLTGNNNELTRLVLRRLQVEGGGAQRL
jgi:two-component sensor histidine kinase